MAKIANKVIGEGFVRFEFADGEFIQCDITKLSSDTITRLALHGISQKVGDSYASSDSIIEARTDANATWRNLVAGVWATKATRGGKIVEALHRATGKPFDECMEKYAGMNDKAKASLRKHPDIKAALAEIEAERAAALASAATDSGNDLNELFI